MALKALKPFEHHSSMVQKGLTGAFKPLLHRSCNTVHTKPPTIDVALVKEAYVILVDLLFVQFILVQTVFVQTAK